MKLIKTPAQSLKIEINEILSSIEDKAGFFNIIQETLKDFSDTSSEEYNEEAVISSWALLPLWACEAVCGRYEQALPAAASLQLLRAAAEVFDDLEDADSSDSLSARYGPAIAINAASALIILAEKAISRLKTRGVDEPTIIRVMEVINSYYTTACAGQHLDLSLASGTVISEEEYLKIVHLKSATTFECACYVGALLGRADQGTIDKFVQFGYNLGMMAQMANDLQGIISRVDIRERKLTLPAIFALKQTEDKDRQQLETAFLKSNKSKPNPEQIGELLLSSGGVYYTSVKMEIFRQTAQDILLDIENSGAKVEPLKTLLE